jgi:hypothetical protein
MAKYKQNNIYALPSYLPALAEDSALNSILGNQTVRSSIFSIVETVLRAARVHK